MNDIASFATASALTRRAFVKNVAWAIAAITAVPRAFHAALTASDCCVAQMRSPVVWFYMDRLCLDYTGAATPYLSARGACSGAPLAHLSEEAFRRAQLYL